MNDIDVAGPPPGSDLTSSAWSWRPAPKFQHRYSTHLVLFLVTLATTTLAGAYWYGGFEGSVGLIEPSGTSWSTFFVHGLWYSVPALTILGAHEFGHYALARYHNVDATLPYFIPGPPVILMTGTFGAVIRIREAFPSKSALFDIGVAGPIAGFIALIPILYWGVSLSQVVPVMHGDGTIYFGEPLLYKAMAWLHFGRIPDGYDVALHPMGFAAWFGMLATALNLMPFGQLDGGHVAYSLLGRRAAMVSIATLVTAAVLTTLSLSWIAMMIMMLVMAVSLGLHHPRVIDEDTPLDAGRRVLAAFALAIFILCFTPMPIQTFLGK